MTPTPSRETLYPQGAARQGVEHALVLAHLLKTLPERGFGRSVPQLQGPGEELVFAKGPDMVSVGPAERKQPAHGAQDVAILDGLAMDSLCRQVSSITAILSISPMEMRPACPTNGSSVSFKDISGMLRTTRVKQSRMMISFATCQK